MSEIGTVHIPTTSRLEEIAGVLTKAMDSAPYAVAHPSALIHLTQHVIAALEDIDVRLTLLESKGRHP